MEIKKIFEDITQIIDESCGIDADSINMEDTLFDKLQIDSIDMVDILFEIETKYDISLKVSDLEQRTKSIDPDNPNEIDGKITKVGVKSILEEMPEIDLTKVKAGMTIEELIKLINIHSLCKIIKQKLDE
jgi:acyl carrier protein